MLLKIKDNLIDKSHAATHINASENNKKIKIFIETFEHFSGDVVLLKNKELEDILIRQLILLLK